jgi:hypothetical protein
VLVSGKSRILFEDFEGADYAVFTGNYNAKGLRPNYRWLWSFAVERAN